MADQHMLSTVDNPYDPFSQYDEWLAYDEQHGYYTNSFLARIVISSDDLSDVDQNLARERAIDAIVIENSLGIYRKVSEENIPAIPGKS